MTINVANQNRLSAASRSSGSLREFAAVVAIAGPIAIAYLAEMAMSATDTILVGRLGKDALAGVGLAATLLNLILFACIGLVTMSGVSMAEARGAGDPAALAAAVRRGLWLSIILAVPGTALAFALAPLLAFLDEPAAVVVHASAYARAVAWCFLPYMAFSVLRNYETARGRATAVMAITLGAVVLNLGLNVVLVFGVGEFAGWGVAGAGYGTSLVSLLMLLALGLVIRRSADYGTCRVFAGLGRIEPRHWLKLARLGLPVALIWTLESGMFAATALLVGAFGASALAANQIATQIAGLAIMVPLAVGQAVTMRIAAGLGAGDARAARRSGQIGLMLSAASMIALGLPMLLAPGAIVALFLGASEKGNPELVGLAVGLLRIVALYQLFDGIQATAACALRGFKDTKAPLVAGLLGYWGVGIAAAALFGFALRLGPAGVWAGQALGLVTVAILLGWRFLRLSARAAAEEDEPSPTLSPSPGPFRPRPDGSNDNRALDRLAA